MRSLNKPETRYEEHICIEEDGKKRRLDEISKREQDVRLVLEIEDGVAKGFDGMEDFDVMALIQKRNKTNDTAL